MSDGVPVIGLIREFKPIGALSEDQLIQCMRCRVDEGMSLASTK